MFENQLLSKIIDENKVSVLNRYNLSESDFYSQADVYKFVKEYQTENGSAPDYRTVVAKFEDFEYTPEVTDNFLFLAKQIKSASTKRQAVELLQNRASGMFATMEGQDFADWLRAEADKLVENAKAEAYSGENYANTGKERWDSYVESKDRDKDRSYIPTPYPSLTEWLGGGFELGEYALLQAYTNRGKSWIASDIGVTAWAKGFGVLHYSPELSYKQQSQRNDTLFGHFKNSSLRAGNLSNEEEYKATLETIFSEDMETPYIIKTMEHLPKGLSVDVIADDLEENPDIKMVIIDGFNLMSHKGSGSNRDKMSNTSRRLRQLFGRFGVVGVVVHQTPTSAEKDNIEEDDTGARIVKPPTIEQYSETVAVIQDASAVLNFDQWDGVGKILLAKARTPYVNREVTLHCDFDNGYIEERTVLDDI